MLKWAVSRESNGLAILSYSTSHSLRGGIVGTDVEMWPLCAPTPAKLHGSVGGSAVKTTEMLSGCLRKLYSF